MTNPSPPSRTSTGVLCASPSARAPSMPSRIAAIVAVPWYLTTDGRTHRQIDRTSYVIRTSDLRREGRLARARIGDRACLRGQSLPPRSRSAARARPCMVRFGFGRRRRRIRRCQVSAPHPEAKSEVPPAIDDGRGRGRGGAAAESGKGREAERNFYWFVVAVL